MLVGLAILLILLLVFRSDNGLSTYTAKKSRRTQRKASRFYRRFSKKRVAKKELNRLSQNEFEEVVILSFIGAKLKVKAKRRYGGEVGATARVTIKGTDFFINACNNDVFLNTIRLSDFASLCHKKNKRGLVVHRGKFIGSFYDGTSKVYILNVNSIAWLILREFKVTLRYKLITKCAERAKQ